MRSKTPAPLGEAPKALKALKTNVAHTTNNGAHEGWDEGDLSKRRYDIR